MAVTQSRTFWIESVDPTYPGGSNKELTDVEKRKLRDPVFDYATYTRYVLNY
jgi:hypothetical protein